MKTRFSLAGALLAFVLPATAALLLGACATGTARPPSDASPSAPAEPAAVKTRIPALTPTQPPSDLGAVERFAWQQVVGLSEAFAAGNADAFLSKVSRGFYRNYTTLETSLRALFENSTARAAVVAVRLVTEEAGRVSVRAEWTRSVTLPDGSVDARHGDTVFFFLKSDTSLRLLDYRGDAPFAIDGI